MSFWTQRLCNMLDSQAPAFQCDIRRMFHSFLFNQYFLNKLCELRGWKAKVTPHLSLLKRVFGENGPLLHLQRTLSSQSASQAPSNLTLCPVWPDGNQVCAFQQGTGGRGPLTKDASNVWGCYPGSSQLTLHLGNLGAKTVCSLGTGAQDGTGYESPSGD